MTADGFRRLALSLPEAHESFHLGHPDFRVGKRVFATLAYPNAASGMVKLTPSQQAEFVALHPQIFVSVTGGWGVRGATNVKLRAATRVAVWPALLLAWKNHARAAQIQRHTELSLQLLSGSHSGGCDV
jgi:hypothetical protein